MGFPQKVKMGKEEEDQKGLEGFKELIELVYADRKHPLLIHFKTKKEVLLFMRVFIFSKLKRISLL